MFFFIKLFYEKILILKYFTLFCPIPKQRLSRRSETSCYTQQSSQEKTKLTFQELQIHIKTTVHSAIKCEIFFNGIKKEKS